MPQLKNQTQPTTGAAPAGGVGGAGGAGVLLGSLHLMLLSLLSCSPAPMHVPTN
jgi:hypothetical protein